VILSLPAESVRQSISGYYRQQFIQLPLQLKYLRRNPSLQNARFLLQTCLLCKLDSVPPGDDFTRAPTSLVRGRAQKMSARARRKNVALSEFSLFQAITAAIPPAQRTQKPYHCSHNIRAPESCC
jgi:hypothetical protein